MPSDYQLSKTDYMLYRESPSHLWAKVHGQYFQTLSPLDEDRIQQGYLVEPLAADYLQKHILSPEDVISFQTTFVDGAYLSPVDALVYKPGEDAYALYEIKSATKLDKSHIEDCAYQYLILKASLNVSSIFLVFLNKDYLRQGELDLFQLFVAKDITSEVISSAEVVAIERKRALQAALAQMPDPEDHCFAPKNCPCPAVCHPGLPEFSIYDIPRLSRKHKQFLRTKGLLSAATIPPSIPLNDEQARVVTTARSGEPYIDRGKLSQELSGLVFPLSFLDYETYQSAIPLYANYQPQQQMVTQYSLHTLDKLAGEIIHTEYICLSDEDPARVLLSRLQQELPSSGTVLVWNKSFEKGRNREMAELHPEYADFLVDLNERIIDLADFVHYGSYVHPDFRGSWSIKNVLPVMVPGLSYKGLAIKDGGEATVAWWKLVHSENAENNADQVKCDLLAYCEMDTLAMVKIYEHLVEIGKTI